ncbi:hypothetical protein J3Q64DRAFT_1759760 [Phycomyces blakesleeanus]|uniref:Uncharacterized protein n=1 Tax=Phycomyces blakesleeanus TaxID=4837 RepID=A0ABR3ASG5_PHYBL
MYKRWVFTGWLGFSISFIYLFLIIFFNILLKEIYIYMNFWEKLLLLMVYKYISLYTLFTIL